MTRQLRIGYAQMLGLSVSVAKDYLRHAITQTLLESNNIKCSEEWLSKHIEEEIFENVKQPSVIFVTDAGKPVGCVFFGLMENLAPWLHGQEDYERIYIDTLFVEPAYRRQGLASLLIRMAASEHPSEKGAVYLNVYENNKKAMALYQHLGFKSFCFEKAFSHAVKTLPQLKMHWEEAKVRFGTQAITSQCIDVTSDEFLLQLHAHGLQYANGGQHIFSIDENEVFTKGMKWRRKCYGLKKSSENHQLLNALPVMQILDGYKNVGVYLDGKMVAFYSLWEPLDELSYLCIFPTSNEQATNIAHYVIYDAMMQLLDWRKEHHARGPHSLAFKPAFHFSYLCITEQERQFWKNEHFTIDVSMMLANRDTIKRKTTLSNDQLEKLPMDMRICYAVATGERIRIFPEPLSPHDWLYVAASMRRKGQRIWMMGIPIDWSLFDKDTLVTLFAAREVYKEKDFFDNVNPSELTVDDWAKIIWICDKAIPLCPAEIWEQFTHSTWEKVMANNTFNEWHWGTLEELLAHTYDSDDSEIKEFFQKHPEYAEKYPIGTSYRYKVSPAEILGFTDFDADGIEYPPLLKMPAFSSGEWVSFRNVYDEDELDEDELN